MTVNDVVFDFGGIRPGKARCADAGGPGNDVRNGHRSARVRDLQVAIDMRDPDEGGNQVSGAAAQPPYGETNAGDGRRASRSVRPDDRNGTRAFGRRVGLRGALFFVGTGVLVVRIVVHVASIAPLEVVVQTAMDRTGHVGPPLAEPGRGEGDRPGGGSG